MELQEIITNPFISLNKIEFKTLPINIENDNIDVNIKDNFNSKISKVDNKLLIDFCREISFEPAQIFNITVGYSISWEFDEENRSIVEEKLGKWNKEEIDRLCFNAISEAVFVVAQLTKVAFMPPLITPCEFIFDDEEE